MAAEGKSRTTHLAEFDGTALPRSRKVVSTRSTGLMVQMTGRALRPPRPPLDLEESVALAGLAEIQRTLRRVALPKGLCAQREDHDPHPHDSPSLGRFWCTADQADREPGRSQRLQG